MAAAAALMDPARVSGAPRPSYSHSYPHGPGPQIEGRGISLDSSPPPLPVLLETLQSPQAQGPESWPGVRWKGSFLEYSGIRCGKLLQA